METPCAQLDFAKEDGTVVGLGDEEGLKEVASEKLEERTEYILVKREVGWIGMCCQCFVCADCCRLRFPSRKRAWSRKREWRK